MVVTRPSAQATRAIRRFEAEGATVIALPVIETVAPDSWDDVDAALERLREGAYEWLVFSSANGVRSLADRARAVGVDIATASAPKIAAVGDATADVVRSQGLAVDLVPGGFSGADLVRELGQGSGRILLPRAEGAPLEMVVQLRSAGWTPDPVAVYRTIEANPPVADLSSVRQGKFDIVTFASGSAVRAFASRVGSPYELGLTLAAKERSVVCIGPSTAATARRRGFRIDAVAEKHTDEGLVDAVKVVWAGRPA